MQLDALVYSIPLRARFRGITVRDGVLLRGPAGWAEVSPFWDYGIEESASWLDGAIDAAVHGYPAPRRTDIPVNVTVPAVGPEEAATIARTGNCGTAKVKIAEHGQSFDDDVARVAAVRNALPTAKIRVDVNGRWSVSEACDRIPTLDDIAGGLEYVEQPCGTVEELAEVRRRVDVPIAADESIRRASDPLRVKQLGAADVVIVKNQPLGGVRRALDIAERIGMPIVVSSALESSVGLLGGVALAACVDELPFACGLATGNLLQSDVLEQPLVPRDGVLTLPSTNTLNRSQLSADEALAQRWSQRLTEMLGCLQGTGALRDDLDVSFRFLKPDDLDPSTLTW